MASLQDMADEIGGSIHDAFAQMDVWVATVARRGHMTAGTELPWTRPRAGHCTWPIPLGMRIFEHDLINETAKKGRKS